MDLFFWKEINELIIKKARKEISNLKNEVTMQLWDNILLITTIIV